MKRDSAQYLATMSQALADGDVSPCDAARSLRAFAERLAGDEGDHRIQAELRAVGGYLASGLLHEVNNPLTYIVGNVDYLRQILLTPSEIGEHLDELREVLDDVEAGSLRIRGAMRDFRELTRTQPPHTDDVGQLFVRFGTSLQQRSRGAMAVETQSVLSGASVGLSPAELSLVWLGMFRWVSSGVQRPSPNQGSSTGPLRCHCRSISERRAWELQLHVRRGFVANAVWDERVRLGMLGSPDLDCVQVGNAIVSTVSGSLELGSDESGYFARLQLPRIT